MDTNGEVTEAPQAVEKSDTPTGGFYTLDRHV